SPATANPASDVVISAINDPFVAHQWYLFNSGQAAFSNAGGALNSSGEHADIRVFDSASTQAETYAKGLTGDGVQVAVIDNGLEIAHPDLSSNVLNNASYNFFSNGKGVHDPTPPVSIDNPEGYHGTAVSGLLGARGGNEAGIWGVAPSAELVGYNLLYEGEGSSGFDMDMELAAIGYANSVANYSGLYSENIDVFNMSYGRNPYQGTNETAFYTSEIIAGLKNGTDVLRGGKGALYFKAGGNEYKGGKAFTADWCQQAIEHEVTCYNVNMENENVTPYQMVIGGFNADDTRASYANTGSALWMVGPAGEYGVNKPALITTDMSSCAYGYSQNQSTDYPFNQLPFNSDFNSGEAGSDNEQCNYFSAFNGTSSATPVMSGIGALLLQANPELTWRDVKHILATTARHLDPHLAAKTMTIGAVPVILEQGWVTNAAGHHYSNAYGFGAPHTNNAIQMALDWKANNTHLPAMQETTEMTGNVPASNEIPDFNAAGLSAKVTVVDNLIAESVELVISIDDLNAVAGNSAANKIDMSDYQIVLRSPNGTESIVLTPFNAYQSGYDMVDLKLISHAFYGESTQGEWTLMVRDVDNATDNRIHDVGKGKLTGWSLKFYGH
uniref:S8 family serine peptidase n=1 Tax=Thiomicrorhabdus cannonii TaxID=2748011 RepID=UPI001C4C3A5E